MADGAVTIFTPPPTSTAQASPTTDPSDFTPSDNEAATSTGSLSQTSDIPPAPESTSVYSPSSDDNGLNTGGIIGIAVTGGLFVLTVILVVVTYLAYKEARKQAKKPQGFGSYVRNIFSRGRDGSILNSERSSPEDLPPGVHISTVPSDTLRAPSAQADSRDKTVTHIEIGIAVMKESRTCVC